MFGHTMEVGSNTDGGVDACRVEWHECGPSRTGEVTTYPR